jgi:hypothetical protein
MKIGEEGYKIQSKRGLFFNKTDVKIKKEEQLTHQVTSTEEIQRKTLNKAVLKGFLAKRRLALCCQGQRAL